MTVISEKIANVNGLMIRYIDPFDPTEDPTQANNIIADQWEADKKLYAVFDMTQVSFTFSQIVEFLAAASKKPENSTGYYPGIENVIIAMFGDPDVVGQIHDWALQEQYHHIESLVYTSENEAITYIREMVDQTA